jgi:hypothetical protein
LINYICPAGMKVNVNTNGFKTPPESLKLRGSWHFDKCISCGIEPSGDCYLKVGEYFRENRIEMDSYCVLKLEKGRT